MKEQQGITVAEMIEEMLSAQGEIAPLGGSPLPPDEQARQREELTRMFAEGKAKMICIGCHEPTSPSAAALCECGSFVCPTCRAEEEEGVCAHDGPDMGDEDEDDDGSDELVEYKKIIVNTQPKAAKGERVKAWAAESPGHWIDFFLIMGEPRGEVEVYRLAGADRILIWTEPLDLAQIDYFITHDSARVDAYLDGLIERATRQH